MNDVKIEIDEDLYKVHNSLLEWKVISFYLYPDLNYKRDNITIDNKDIGVSYKLLNEGNDFFIIKFGKEVNIDIKINKTIDISEMYITSKNAKNLIINESLETMRAKTESEIEINSPEQMSKF